MILRTCSIPAWTQLTQEWAHTPSIAFRHVPPNSARFSTPLKRHSYLRTAVHRRGQSPPKGLGTNQTPSTGLRHPSFRTVPESDARSVGMSAQQLFHSVSAHHPFVNRSNIVEWLCGHTSENASRLGYKHVCGNYLKLLAHGIPWLPETAHTHTHIHTLTQWLTESFYFFSFNFHLSFNTNSNGEWKFQIFIE